MRNKIYIYAVAGIFTVLFFLCPVSFLINKTGVIEIEDLANYKDPEKVYYFDEKAGAVKTAAYNAIPEEDAVTDASLIPLSARLYMNILNGIEEGKAAIDTVYTNYLPFYAETLRFVNSNDSYIQGEFVMMLYNWENPKNSVLANSNNETSELIETIEITETTKTIETDANTEVNKSNETEITENTKNDADTKMTEQPAVQSSQPQFIAFKVSDAGMFRVYRVRSQDDSIGFLDISMAMRHEQAAANMLDEQYHVKRIAESHTAGGANSGVNFYVYLATRMQDTAYYNEIVPASSELSTKDIFDDFVNGVKDTDGLAGIAWLDIDTFDKRMERCFKTDHHWNALGAYQGYTEVINMMRKSVPDIGDPLPLKGLIEFPGVEYRGSGAARTQTPVYYDTFAVMDIDLPVQHPSEKVTSKLNDYSRGRYDIDRLGKNDYTGHYENFYNRPDVITYPENSTGRKLLILGDSYVYWVSWLIGSHFDKTFVHYTLDERDLNYNKFIKDNGITDVLLLQYSARTLSKATSATKYLEQIIIK